MSLFALLAEERKARSLPILAQIDAAAARIESDASVSKASGLAKAVGYLSRQWASLIRFVEAPHVMIHNNDAERAIRMVAVGRKNYLFAGSQLDAEVAATLYSLLGTCRVLDLPVQRYLTEVAERLIAEPSADVSALTPWAWARKNELPLPVSVSPED